jgi:DNA repair exonuclease SbcCD ATPase subunit
MTSQSPELTQEVTTTQTATVDPSELSFSDYERMRRGEPIAASKAEAAAPAKKAEQKEVSESATEETEAKEETDDEEEVEETESNADESEKDDKPKKKKGWSKRVEKLVAQREAERRRAEALEARLAALEVASGPKKSDSEPAKTAQAATDSGEPNPDDFTTHAEYVKAVTKWTIQQEQKAAKAEAEKQKLLTQQEQAQKSYQEKLKSFIEKTDDFDDVVSEVSDISPSIAVQELIMSSDMGPQLVYELAKNRAEFERINSLSYGAVARELGKLEAKLEARASEQTKKPEPKKLTQAPKPLDPVGGGKGTVAKSIDDPDLSFADYERIRREQMKRRGA